jgi:hypothetical protein
VDLSVARSSSYVSLHVFPCERSLVTTRSMYRFKCAGADNAAVRKEVVSYRIDLTRESETISEGFSDIRHMPTCIETVRNLPNAVIAQL